MTRAWLASRPEKKRKKNVDTGASKGRKIRYLSVVIHLFQFRRLFSAC